ncbi:MAG: hypothetical protein IJ475_02055 [Bacilli bacterium]|nr:hypothetical protein [Bacilli bacterium]
MSNINEFEKIRTSLENEYNLLETKISSFYENDKVSDALKLEHTLNLIDDQLDLLDEIISNLRNTPKLVERFNDLNKEYNKIVGE